MFVKIAFASPKYNSVKIGIVKIDEKLSLTSQYIDKAKEAIIENLSLDSDTTVFTSGSGKKAR
jgi:hypothetical protein